jgi:aminopeptidase N
MKKLIYAFCFLSTFAIAQEHSCAKNKIHSAQRQLLLQARMAALSPQISHELKYDVKFVHLNLNVERINKYISGGVKTIAKVVSAPLDTFMTLLHQNLTIDSIRFNGVLVTAIRQDSIVKFKTPVTLSGGSTFTANVYYKGTPPTGGSAIGSGFSNGTSQSWGNQATWSLSESFVAYHWWPTKQILTDKIDSSWVYVTTDSINKAGSNGLLKNVVVVGNKKRYEWKSRYPIDYYLISVAVAKYKEYKQYAKPQYLINDSIFIQNYIYDGAINNANWIANQKPDLDKMPQVMKFLCNQYGMYPFYKEKYGHCMAPFSGGMEHQTMTSIGFFEYYINAHELGHQWWGDQVTCKSWGDIWINEGFASYTEHLVAQYLDPTNFATNLNSAHTNVMSQNGGSCHFTNADTLNTGRIFSSRLTYDKGGAIIHSLRFLTNNDSLWFNCLRGFQNQYKNSTASVIDFKNYYQTFTSINPTQFFNQWYYGEGYPTFNVKYNFNGSQFFLKNTETVSMPSVTPLFITPIEYKISRSGKPDTTLILMQNVAIENYTLSLTGTVTAVVCDPNNWLINKTIGPSRDANLGVAPNLVSIDEGSAFAAIQLGPNPSKDVIMVTNENLAKGTVVIKDLQGRFLQSKTLERETVLDVRNYAAGIYLVTIQDAENKVRFQQKVIKE